MVRHLFLKKRHGKPLNRSLKLDVQQDGIGGNVVCPPLRQVLILPLSTLVMFHLKPGDLRENIVTEGIDLHSLQSGTVIKIGKVKIHLTFHCEPCKVISDKVNLRDIKHKRGVLGRFINTGSINIGDSITIEDESFDPIPYDIKDRIKWYLTRQNEPVPVTKLVHDIGLSNSYCRAIPSMLKSRPDINSDMIIFKSRRYQSSNQLGLDLML